MATSLRACSAFDAEAGTANTMANMLTKIFIRIMRLPLSSAFTALAYQ